MRSIPKWTFLTWPADSANKYRLPTAARRRIIDYGDGPAWSIGHASTDRRKRGNSALRCLGKGERKRVAAETAVPRERQRGACADTVTIACQATRSSDDLREHSRPRAIALARPPDAADMHKSTAYLPCVDGARRDRAHGRVHGDGFLHFHSQYQLCATTSLETAQARTHDRSPVEERFATVICRNCGAPTSGTSELPTWLCLSLNFSV